MIYCTCRNAKINTEKHGPENPFCERCGYWWDERYGSVKPGAPLPPQRQPNNQYRRAAPKTGRNDPCPCGSGKKAKKCCMSNAESEVSE